MHLFFHLAIHFTASILAGILVWWGYGEGYFLTAVLAGILGGFLIDLDHIIDYYLAFGWKFKLSYFLKGYQFLKSDKIYIFFHGWEYVALLSIGIFLFTFPFWLEIAILSISLGAFFHLVADAMINHGMTFQGYSLFYRARRRFEAEKILTSQHYQEHSSEKKKVFFQE